MNFGELEILHYKVLTRTVSDFAFEELLGSQLLPEERVEGITAQWDILSPTRQKGTFRIPGEPATRVELERVASRTATCILMLLEKALDEATLAWLRLAGEEDVASARARITAEQMGLARRIQLAREWAVWQALCGELVIDQDNLKLTVDYGLDASHKPTAAASWGLADTDIPGDVRAWKKLIAQDSGYVAGEAFVNEGVMEKMIRNDNVKDVISDTGLKEQLAQEGYITRFMGLDWHVYDAGYLDASGTFHQFVPDDSVIIVPGPKVYGRMQVGTQEVPMGFNETVRVYGSYSYAVTQSNPPGVNLYVGENFLPVITLPGAIVCADVTPA